MDQKLFNLVERVGGELVAKGWRCVTAESCTGGLVAGALTEVPGSSDWFERGFVTYSNEAKIELLGVPAELIADHGAVSEQVVAAMAKGALQRSHGDIAVAVSGVAGPSGGTKDKPVGLVWFAWATRGSDIKVQSKVFHYNRAGVRREAVVIALQGIHRELA